LVRRSLVSLATAADPEGTDMTALWEVRGMTRPELLCNEPVDFDKFVGAPHHRLFAIFDDPVAAEEAVEALHFEGFADERDLWVFCGEEGARRLDVSGQSHGIWTRGFRTLQKVMSSDFGYLRTLDEALRGGGTVVAVWASDLKVAEEVARLLQLHAGHSIAYGAHLDFVPVPA
jgi:hypothetical protein